MKVLGMGNALLDIVINLPGDKILDELDLPKGSMQLIDFDRHNKIQAHLEDLDKELTSGGSAANTVHGLAALGLETGFVGSIGKDNYGEYFEKDMKGQGISPAFRYSDSPTGRAMALVSPDSERTFGTFLGAAMELSAEDIDKSMFEGYDLLHIEGYLVQNHELIEKAVRLAREKGLDISIDLASYNIVDENRDFLREILKKYVTLVFANEEEARSMTGKEPEEALNELQKLCEIAVVKVGKDGSWIKANDDCVHVDAIKANPVDTSGAGDIYAAGFLYGMSKKLSLSQCGQIGSILAGNVIQFLGPKIPLEVWGDIIAETRRVEVLF